jgi:hypothetical protein
MGQRSSSVSVVRMAGKTERVMARVLTGFDDEQFLNETL